MVSFTSLLFLFDYVFGSINSYAIGLSFLVMLLALIAVYSGTIYGLLSKRSKGSRKNNLNIQITSLPRWAWISALAITVIIAIIFIAGTGNYSNGIYCIDASCSDALYHIGIGYSVAFGNFPPEYYFTVGTKNVFPFMSDLYMGMLHRFGMGIVGALLLPDVMLVFSFVWLSMMVAYAISKSTRISIISTIMFWFGGVGFIKILDFPFIKQITPLFQPAHLFYLPQPHNTIPTFIYSVLKMSEIPTSYWTSIINSMLLAQRDLLLGLPLALIAIYIIYLGFFSEKRFGAKEYLFLGVLAGMLPLANAESVIVVAFLGIFSLLYLLVKKGRFRNLYNFALAAIPFAIIGSIELSYMASQKREANWSYFIYQNYILHGSNVLITMVLSIENIVFFWLQVAGIPVILGLLGLYYAKRNSKAFFVPFMALWVFVTVYTPQPNPADSNKIFLYVFLALCIFMAYLIDAMWKKGRLWAVFGVLLVVLVIINFPLFFTHDVFAAKQPLLTNAEISAASYITNNTPKGAVFVVNDYNAFRNPVSSIAMRQTLISIGQYVGGIYKYQPQLMIDATIQIMSKASCPTAVKYNVSYAYLENPNATTLQLFNASGFDMVFNYSQPSIPQKIYVYKLNCS
ncbi:MAG: hypothetical protein QXR73_02155 [Candidatus Micrarchaeaceae archaeon]